MAVMRGGVGVCVASSCGCHVVIDGFVVILLCVAGGSVGCVYFGVLVCNWMVVVLCVDSVLSCV